MKRFLHQLIFAAALTAGLCGLCDGATSQPNILFIMADDHAWQAISACSDPRHLIQTPNINRLANLMQELSRLRKELKEPEKDDPKAYGSPTQFPP